jgi:hypothetical protein
VVVVQDGLPFIPPGRDVIDLARILDAQGPSHAGRLLSHIHIFTPDAIPMR